MSRDISIEPPDVARLVEQYVDDEQRDASKYDNRMPLDESGVYSLHLVAAHIYALGYDAGKFAERERNRGHRDRARDASTPGQA